MTPHPEQLWLLPTVPRRLEPGEAPLCLTCGRRAPNGYYGPPGTDTVWLDDGNEHTIELRDTWFCRRHAKARWAEWRRCQQQLTARRRWLAAHRHVEALGVTAARERFPMVEALLADPAWQPGADSDARVGGLGVSVSYGKNHPGATIGRGEPVADVTATAPNPPPIGCSGRNVTSTDSDGQPTTTKEAA